MPFGQFLRYTQHCTYDLGEITEIQVDCKATLKKSSQTWGDILNLIRLHTCTAFFPYALKSITVIIAIALLHGAYVASFHSFNSAALGRFGPCQKFNRLLVAQRSATIYG